MKGYGSISKIYLTLHKKSQLYCCKRLKKLCFHVWLWRIISSCNWSPWEVLIWSLLDEYLMLFPSEVSRIYMIEYCNNNGMSPSCMTCEPWMSSISSSLIIFIMWISPVWHVAKNIYRFNDTLINKNMEKALQLKWRNYEQSSMSITLYWVNPVIWAYQQSISKGILNILLIVWQRLCELARLRITFCLSVCVSAVLCLVCHTHDP